MEVRTKLSPGQRFGRLTVLEGAPRHRDGKSRARFRCTCGVETVKVIAKVKSGHTKSCGCLKNNSWRATLEKDLVGKRYCRLVVQSRSPRRTRFGGTRWICSCDCGGETEVALNNLRNGTTRSCGCLARERASRMGKTRKGKRAWNWKGVGGISGSFWNQILAGADQRGLEVKVTHQDIWDLFQKQKEICALSGFSLCFDAVGERSVGNASLDRIDSSKGYVPGNIQWVDKRIQQMKWDMGQDEFLALCGAVAKNHLVTG